MQRYHVALAALLSLAVVGQTAQAANLFKTFTRDFRRNNCWPEPFTQPDRIAVRAPLALMVHNGWRLQNTLSDHHFNEETAQLNEAGELKVQEVLTEAPAQFRTLFVLRDVDPEVTANRLKSVEESAGRLAMEGDSPSVIPVGTKPRGWSADDIDATGRKYRASMPEPRLPERGGGSEK